MTRANKLRFHYSAMLVVALLFAQYIVFSHTHDSLHHNTDALCKICISGEHLGHGLASASDVGVPSIKEFFLVGSATKVYINLFFTCALARAPPAFF